LQYLLWTNTSKSLPYISNFFTLLLNYLNRIILLSKDSLFSDLQASNIDFSAFIDTYFSKMDFLVSVDSKRLNLLGIYSLLPVLPSHLLQKHFPEIARLTFGQLDNYLQLKMAGNEARFMSPSKMAGSLKQRSTALRIQQIQNISKRTEQLKKIDPIFQVDIVDFFREVLQLTC